MPNRWIKNVANPTQHAGYWKHLPRNETGYWLMHLFGPLKNHQQPRVKHLSNVFAHVTGTLLSSRYFPVLLHCTRSGNTLRNLRSLRRSVGGPFISSFFALLRRHCVDHTCSRCGRCSCSVPYSILLRPFVAHGFPEPSLQFDTQTALQFDTPAPGLRSTAQLRAFPARDGGGAAEESMALALGPWEWCELRFMGVHPN